MFAQWLTQTENLKNSGDNIISESDVYRVIVGDTDYSLSQNIVGDIDYSLSQKQTIAYNSLPNLKYLLHGPLQRRNCRSLDCFVEGTE